MIFYFSYDEYNDFFYFDELFSIGQGIFKLMLTGLMSFCYLGKEQPGTRDWGRGTRNSQGRVSLYS
jgi:hypothetical protein